MRPTTTPEESDVVIGKLASEIRVTRFSDKVNRDTDGDYVLTGGGYPYEIDRERINAAPKLAGWIRHLSAKTWFKAKDARELIDLVSHDYPKVIPSTGATHDAVRLCGNDDLGCVGSKVPESGTLVPR